MSIPDPVFGSRAEMIAALASTEPGRTLTAAGMSLVAQVLHRGDDPLYLNDGVWGGLIESMQSNGKLRWPTRVYRRDRELNGETRAFTLFGPTCDSLDRLHSPFPLPTRIHTGDWIELGIMGACSLTNRTGFNGFYPNSFVRIKGIDADPPAATHGT